MKESDIEGENLFNKMNKINFNLPYKTLLINYES